MSYENLKHEVMTREDTIKLITRAQNGDDDAVSTLLINNIPLVKKVVGPYRNMGVSYSDDDLIQEGIFGLMDAIYKYDPSFETQFSTYAFFWIKQRIQRFLVYNQSTLKIPAHAGEIIYARKVIKNENPDLTEEEIFQEIKRRYSREELSLKTYYAVLKATGVSSLNVLTGEDGDTEIMDFIADETLSNVEDSAILESESAELHHIMKEKLRPKEYDVMVLRYGMFGNTPHTLQEVAEVFGCTRERIRQIEQRAMERLQTAYKIPYNKKVTYLKDMRSIKAIFEGIFINEPDISYLDAKNKLSEKYKNKIDDNDIFQCYEEAKDNLEEYRQLA